MESIARTQSSRLLDRRSSGSDRRSCNEDRGAAEYRLKQVSGDAPMWHVNWLLECSYEQWQLFSKAPERHCELVLEGMQYPWFVLGMLEADLRYLPFLHGHYKIEKPTALVRSQVLVPMIQRFLTALPELMTFYSRIDVRSRKDGVRTVGIGKRLNLFWDLIRCGWGRFQCRRLLN